MCKRRDIILVDQYKSHGNEIGRHSFVVIDDTGDSIQGLPYDIVCNVLSSFKSESQKRQKLSYPGNFPITATDVLVPSGNTKAGYIKTDQLYFFKKDLISYRIIGEMTEESFDELVAFIENSDLDLEIITDNL